MKRMIVFIMMLFMLFCVVPVIPTTQVHAEGNTKGFLLGLDGHDVSNVPSSWFASLPTDNFVGRGGTELGNITTRNVVVVFGHDGSACTTAYLEALIKFKKSYPKSPVSIVFYDMDTTVAIAESARVEWESLSGYVSGKSSCQNLLDNCKGYSITELPVVAYVHDKRLIDVTYGSNVGVDTDGALFKMDSYNNFLPLPQAPELIPAATSTSICVLSNAETKFTISGEGNFLVVANPPMRSGDSNVQIAFNTSANNAVAGSSTTSVLDSTNRVAYNVSKFMNGTYYLQLKSKNATSENTIYSSTQFQVIINNGVASFPVSVADYNNQQLSNTQGDSQTILDYWKKGSNSPLNNWINSTDSTIVTQANDIISKCTTDYSKILAIHDWVSANIYYDYDYYNQKATGYDDSVNVLKYKRAVCQGYADLTVALLRAAGIPAKVDKGYAGTSPTQTKPSNHAWTSAYCQSQNRWMILDTTWDSGNSYTNGIFSDPQPIRSVYFDPTLQKFSLDHRIDSFGIIDGAQDPDAIPITPIYQYSVKFSVDGTIIETKPSYSGCIINAPTDPNKTKYVFDGWYTSASGGQQVYFQYKVIRNVTLYAHWRPATIIFDTNGGDVTSQTAYYNAEQGDIKNPVRVGYTFAGWYTDAVGGNAISFPLEITREATVFAHWNANPTSTVTFNANGGLADTSQTVNSGATVNAPPTPTYTNYSFAGWYTQASGGTQVAFPYTVTGDATLYAHWTATLIKYTVTFKANGGSPDTRLTVNSGSTIAAPTDPTYTGKCFAGWYTVATGGTKVAFPYTVNGNIQFYAHWSTTPITKYTVTFNSNGGTPVENEIVNYNETVAVPTAPTKIGYTFAGWYTTSALTTAWDFATNNVTTNITLYAKWTVATPSTPISVKSVSSNYNTIKVSWAAASNANQYKVYRATSSAGSYTMIATVSTTSYSNTSLTTGKKYYYKVVAIDISSGKTSGYSAVVRAAPVLPAVKLSSVRKSKTTSAKVTYSAVSGASGYKIYYGKTSAVSKLAGTSKTKTYTKTSLAKGKTYYFKVRAYRIVNGKKVYGGWSAVKSVKR